jgi:D-galactarolactone isomerase
VQVVVLSGLVPKPPAVDAVARLGANNARAVAVLHPTVTDAELKKPDAGGVRGIRFTLGDPATAVVTVDMIEPLAKRVASLGWHIQFNVNGEQIIQMADLMWGLPTPSRKRHETSWPERTAEGGRVA